MGDFPSQVNAQQAPAVAGDFASTNPRSSFLAGPGGLVAGPSGVSIARFAWAVSPQDWDNAPSTVNSFGVGLPSGFVHREQQGTFTTYLAASGNAILKGFGLTLMTSGDYWVTNDGSTAATPGMKAYANFRDGKVSFAATASAATGATSSASAIVATTFSATGSITGSILNVTAVGSGTIVNGATISGTGISTGNQIVSQLTGSVVGGVGTYAVSIGEQATASVTVSGTYGVLTVGGTVAGTFHLNDLLAATGSVAAGTSITQLLTGAGGAGTYVVNNNTGVTSQAINVAATNVETKYICESTGAAGELVKMSSYTNA